MRRQSMEPAPGRRNRTGGTRSRRSRGAIALRIALAVTVVLVLGEVAARLTGFVDRVNPFPRQLYVTTGVADLPYRLRPGVSLDVRGSRVDVNELGMRDRAGVARMPAAGVHRILVLGDSVAFGWLQNVDRAFARRLEDALDARTTTGDEPAERFEVLNAGVPGYNAVAEAAWFRDYGAALAPETVVVAVNLNDFDRVPHLNGLGILSTDDNDRASPLSPANWSELYLALRWAALLARGDPRIARETAPTPTAVPPVAGAARKPTSTGDSPRSTPAAWDRFDRYVSNLRKRFYHDPTEPQWGDLVRAWRDLVKRAHATSARVVFVLFPDGDQIGVPDPDLVPQQRLLALCAEEGFECLDLTPAFQAAAPGGPLHTDIMHPNDAGHALAAQAVADQLAR
jgi:GDSL-like Lipase/Acylhydrolase family